MSDLSRDEQLALLLRDVDAWNRWRTDNPGQQTDLSGVTIPPGTRLHRAILGRVNLDQATLDGVDLSEADLGEAKLRGASLEHTNLTAAKLPGAVLTGADLTLAILYNAELPGAKLVGATLRYTNLRQADLQGVDLSHMDLRTAILHGAKLPGAILIEAQLPDVELPGADLTRANLTDANLESTILERANLTDANLTHANLTNANLRQANLTNTILDNATLQNTDLTKAQLIGTRLHAATLSDCSVYGISTWDLSLDNATQTNLRITPDSDVEITSDDLEVAQFLYLMLHNEKIRRVIDTITSKVVLILGRFTPERKLVLDAIRNDLRNHPNHYVPVLFDFEESDNASMTETIKLLAQMARFVIADLTEPASVPYELGIIVPDAHVAVQTLLLEGTKTFSMAKNLWQLHPHLMLPLCRYKTLNELLTTLTDRVIAPAEERARELQRQKTLPVDGLS